MRTAAELAARFDAGGWTAEPPPPPVAPAVQGAAEGRWIRPGDLVAAVRAAKEAGFFFESMTCIDRLDPHGAFEFLYTLNRYDAPSPQRLALRLWSAKDAAVPSLADVFPIAAWNEREAWEFYGVAFAGHPNLTWLLLPEGTEFRPLLKSFTAPPPSVYDGSAGRGVDGSNAGRSDPSTPPPPDPPVHA